jgi:CubicO group peptidase (beta-lactamase class C family)
MTTDAPRPDRRLLLAAGASLAMAGPASARVADPGDYEAHLDLAFSRAGPPALAGMVVGRSGATWIGVRGVRRQGAPEPVTVDDRWHVGSNTKAMTAALFARAVQSGATLWDLPLARAFPDLTVHPRWAAATLDDLMRHRAGLVDASVMGQSWLMAARSDPRSLVDQRTAIAAAALAAPPTGNPGAFAYGNANYVLVGAALERITGTSWETRMAADLFQPLGLTSAGFGAPADPAPWGHGARGGVSTPIGPGPYGDNPAALGPAGTAHMSLADYGRFLAVWLDGGKGWLTGPSLARLMTPFAGTGASYGYGWGVLSHPLGGRDRRPGPLLTHDGSNTYWYLSAALLPERGLAVVAASNDAGRGSQAVGDLIQRLLRAAAG